MHSDSQFDTLISAIQPLNYRELRDFLWNNVRPRPELFLYRFREVKPDDPESINRIRQIIVGSQLWLSSPEDFNDPFDMAAKIMVEGTLKEKQNRFYVFLKTQRKDLSWRQRRQLLPSFVSKPSTEYSANFQKAFDKSIRNAGVCSFGIEGQNILMWSHYGACHTGVCFQFEVARDPATFLQAVPVEYDQNFPTVNWIKEYEKSLQVVMTRKHPNWAYEKERRIVIPGGARRQHSFRPEALTGIILGCRADEAVEGKLKNLLDERAAAGLPMPRIYQAQVHGSQYRLVVRRKSSPFNEPRVIVPAIGL